MGVQYFNLSTGDYLQDWSVDQITTNDDWSPVPNIVGYNGEYAASNPTGVNPQTLTQADLGVAQVFANTTSGNPSGGGVYEVVIGGNRMIALNGSGSADAPNFVLRIDATGRKDLTLAFDVYDLDASADNATQQFAVMYRIGDSGVWTNLPDGYIADATTVSAATQVTHREFSLPSSLDGVANIQLRFQTTNAVGNDELIGVDNIKVHSVSAGGPAPLPTVSISDVTLVEGANGVTEAHFVVTRTSGSGAFTVDYATADGTATAGSDYASKVGTLTFGAGDNRVEVVVQVNGDATVEPDETFFVNLTNPSGATISDGQGQATISNDDVAPVVTGTAWINEFHYDNAGTDANEFVEVAGPAGLNLAGYKLVFYNGDPTSTSGGKAYATITLTGTIPEQQNGVGTLSFGPPSGGIQNGAQDAIALVAPDGHVVEFLSYEGVMTATDGPAVGLTSTDVLVAEEPAPAAGGSIARTGVGNEGADFQWTLTTHETHGSVNDGQSFMSPTTPKVSVAASDATGVEGSDTSVAFTLTRTGDTSQALTVNYSLGGTATPGDDFTGPTGGTVTFAAGSATAVITYGVVDDTVREAPETLTLTVQSGSGYAVSATKTATATITSDEVAPTKISAIQGAGAVSGMVGQTVTVEAVVVGDFQSGDGDATRDIGGFFVQEELVDEDGNPLTSEGLFIADGATPGVNVANGDKVMVTGVVTEQFGITSLTNVTVSIVGHNAGGEVQTAVLNLPNANLEALEGMRVTVPQTLVVTSMEDLDRLGETHLYASEGDGLGGQVAELADGRPYTYTQINEPNAAGNAAYNAVIDSRSIIYDDGLNGTWRPITNPNGGGVYNTANAIQTGDSITGLTGVLDYGFSNWRIRSTEDGQNTFTDTNPREDAPHDVGGSLTVGSFNVLNFFVTQDLPGVTTDNGQDPRGADSAAEFERQAAKLVKALITLDADVLALVELENDFSTGASFVTEGNALGYIVSKLNEALGGDIYSYVDPGMTYVGTDAISTGFIYKNDVVRIAEGTHVAIDMSAINDRPTVAVTFEEIATGGVFTAVANHFKSKGSGSGVNADKGDGQGASVADRVAQANRLLTFLAANPTGTTDADYLLLGDFNAYYQEDPIDVLRGAGFQPVGGPTAYSYTFDGQVGSLDHAMPNTSLAGQVTGSTKWHINSEESPALDYNLDADDTNPATNRDPSIFDGTVPYRVSDHDPILVGLNLTPTDKVLAGTAGADTLVGKNGNDRLTGADGDDVLSGGLGNDTLDGGKGDDILAGGQGDDRLIGGDGVDTAWYAGARGAYTVARGEGGVVLISGPEGSDTLDGVEWLQFSDGKFEIAQILNRTPVAVADTVAAQEDGPAVVLNLLANDSDPDGDALKIVSVDGAGLKGSVTLNSDGTVTYNPGAAFQSLAAGATASETFSYTVTDRFGATSTATATVVVTGVNDTPVAVADTGAAQEDGPAVVLNLLANDSDPDGDTLTILSVDGAGLKGSVTLNADGTVSYNPGAAFQSLAAGATATETFSYTVTDSSGAVSTASVSLLITGVNDAPVTAGDTASVNENGSVTIDVLRNDSDVDGDTLALAVGGTTAKGAHVSVVDGKLVYVADADSFDLLGQGQTATDSFTYQVSDGHGGTSTATVTVTVSGVADATPIFGGNGADTLTGGAAEDRIDGGNGADKLTGGAGADTLIGANGDDKLYGGLGIDSLSGGNGDDLLDGGFGADTLAGGLGADTFVFGQGFGKDVVKDFKPGDDHLQLAKALFADFADVMAHAKQVGADVVITYDDADTITLTGVNLANLHSGDFLFA